MYPVSTAFHTAIQAGAPQKALLLFADTVFTDADIAARGGLLFSEPFCSQTDLTIGLCPSATLTAGILNSDGLLNGFAFGEFTGYLGVKTLEHSYTPVSGATATLYLNSSITLSIHDTTPYVRENGVGLATQPSFAPQAIVVYDTDVYVISAAGVYFKYTYTGGARWSDLASSTWADLETDTWAEYIPTLGGGEVVATNDFMGAKGITWAAAHTSAIFTSNILRICETDGTYNEYEMCPLGVFNADRPLTRRKSVIKFTAYDHMNLFDQDVTTWWAGLTFPLTLGEIFASLCTYVGVTPSTTTFINSTHSYTTAPFASNTLTGRAMLKYIAEAACAIARFDRDGKLELAWLSTIAYTTPEASIVSGAITLAEYEAAAIDKLQIQAETTDIGVVIGTGTNAYVLLASPLIVGESDAEIRAFATPIYNRLIAFTPITPISARVKADWSLQSGDITDIIYEGNTYSMPIYTQSIAWAGDGRSTLASTGAALRDALTVTNREQFTASQKMTLIEKSVDGINVTLTNKVGADEIIGKINLSAEEAKIAFGKITLEGYTTINDYFKVNLDGSIEAVNGKFSGTLEAVSGTFDTLSSTDGSIGIGGLLIEAEDLISETPATLSSTYDMLLASDGLVELGTRSGGVITAPLRVESGVAKVVGADSEFFQIPADVDGVSADAAGSVALSAVRYVSQSLTTGEQTQVRANISAAAASHTHSDYVPTSRTVNGKALSSDITLSASDVSAAATSHAHGNVTSDGKIGSAIDQFVVTGTAGALTAASPASARGTMDAQQTIYYGSSAPASPYTGQIWIKPKA